MASNDQGITRRDARRLAFDAFRAAGREGRGGAWPFAGGLLLVVFVYVGASLLGLWLAAQGYAALGGDVGEMFFQTSSQPVGASAAVLLGALGGISATILAVAFALRLLHRRPFGGVLGAERRLRPGAALIGAGGALAAILATTPLAMALDVTEFAYRPPPDYWALLALAIGALVFFQAAAEEIVFRGYILQWLAARFRSPIVWALAPSLIFGALHLSGGSAATDASYLVMTTGFGLFAAALVWATGGLSQAIGYHIANNLIALLVFEPPMGVNGIGPIEMRIDEADLPMVAAVNLVGLAVAYVVITAASTPETPRPALKADPRGEEVGADAS